MHSTFALLAGLVATVAAVPQAVTSAVAPASSAPAGCSASYPGSFEIETVNVTSTKKRSLPLESRQTQVLTITLSNGVLTDSLGRTGYIASNQQFQFDGPPQAGALYTSGFSVCSNGSLAIGGSTIFQQCLTSNYYNLYFNYNAPQCNNIYIQVLPVGQASAPATQLSDGQPQATPVPITQISDGQPQAPTGVVTQLSDGQPQAPTGVVVTQISDGQPQAPTGAVVTQISDGQPQAPTSKAVVTQISDGQPQAPVATAKPTPVSQSGDGQIVAPTQSATATRSAPATYSGAAAPKMHGEFLGLAAGVLAVALL